MIVHQNRLGRRAEAPGGPLSRGLHRFEEPLAEGQNVFPTLPQRRKIEGKHVDAVVEIFPEAAAANQGFKIPVGGGDEANVHRYPPRGAQGKDFPLLDESEQGHLGLGRQLVNLIKKEGAGVGDFQFAGGAFFRAGEGAAFIAEQLGFDEPFGDGAAVDGHEAPGGAPAGIVDEPGDHLFAGSRFTLKKQGGILVLDHIDCAVDLAETGVGGFMETAQGTFQFTPQEGILGFQAPAGQGFPDNQGEFVHLNRLGEIVECSGFEHLDGAADRSAARNHHHGNFGVFPATELYQIHSRAPGHFQIRHHHVVSGFFQEGFPAIRVPGAVHPEAPILQEILHQG